jgi:hypothetical protein
MGLEGGSGRSLVLYTKNSITEEFLGLGHLNVPIPTCPSPDPHPNLHLTRSSGKGHVRVWQMCYTTTWFQNFVRGCFPFTSGKTSSKGMLQGFFSDNFFFGIAGDGTQGLTHAR